ncbi:RagB/SusD family nutrient uptake outer membrane protein [termite gut metagenome]|uniref:RagB/SusD family nutrient uptake outer membrane protein n=1 Tax=termite gut metagenome TaxID=433724 RepID=A0A5J4RSD1_9ZZZZ
MIMKITNLIKLSFVIVGGLLSTTSCVKDLLDQDPTVDLAANAFWKTEDDATYALYGAYADIRPLFDRDYYFEGQSEYVRVRGTSATNGNLRNGDAYHDGQYRPGDYGSNFDKMYRYLFGGINRANYVIDNVEQMLPDASATSKTNLEAIIGEARLLRGMIYFRLISMWGDVPLIEHIVSDNSEVSSITRTPIAQIKDFIMADFTYAFEKLPAKSSEVGRAAKPAALAFRGKLQLYWACWNNFGWPELSTFTPSASEATSAYAAAAADFKAVIDNYDLKLFRNGEPGPCDPPGKADNLPNYYYLFTPVANGDPEMIMVFTHGGLGTNQGEELMRDFAGRNHEGSQVWATPRYELANLYQSITTGEFCTPLLQMNPDVVGKDLAYNTPNSALNPQSYADRDYRMKATIQWDYETSIGFTSRVSTGWCPFIYKTWNTNITTSNYEQFPGLTQEHIGLITYNTDGSNSGYVFRKFVRNTPGLGRSEGNYNWPVMRLADVYLMYAEAINEVNNGPDAKAIDLINQIRHRGNLPPLKADKTATKEAFFSALEQERIIELLGEGYRGFDLRRWRAIERVWCPPYDNNGVWRMDTYGANMDRYFQNQNELYYQRCYIFRIPPGERDRNPNLTQNTPWL